MMIYMEHISNTYVINLDDDTERLKKMKEQIPKLGKQFKRISAIKGKNLTKKEIQNETTFLCSKFCTYSMIGCFLSHKKAWKTMIENNDKYAIIMEDDCELSETFQEDLKKVMDELIPQKPDFIYLGCFGACEVDKNYGFFALLQKYSILYRLQNLSNYNGNYSYVPEAPVGFHCYIISNDCAKYLLKNMEKADYHVDVSFLKHSKNLKIFASSKKLGTQFATSGQSTQCIDFPISLNNIFDNIKDRNKVSYSYYFSAPIIEILWNPINLYLIFACIIAFIIPNKQNMITIFTFFLIYEFILNPKNINIISFWYVLIYIIYRIKK